MQRSILPLLAIVLALLVLVPNVAPAGSWASPTPVEHVDAVGLAQLVPPAADDPIMPAHVVLLIIVALWLGLPLLGDVVQISSPREPLQPPGRRGRALLQAYRN